MGYRVPNTNVAVGIVHLRLGDEHMRRCNALRKEAGRCWTDLLLAHVASRDGVWLSETEMKAMSKGKYALHSQSVQALVEKLIANIDTARELRKEHPDARYPYRSKSYQTVVWKAQAIRVIRDTISLSNGQGRIPLVLSLPPQYSGSHITKCELTWRADHYELCLTVDSGESNPPLNRHLKSMGVDLGEINIAVAVTDEGVGANIGGRYLRSLKRLRNKRHAALTSRIDKCKDGSKRRAQLLKHKARASARLYRQSRDVLHKASRKLVDFAVAQNVAHIAVGDVRDIADGVDIGHKSNQKVSQWAHGQFVAYVRYKARKMGISVDYIPEDYSTRTCSGCGAVKNNAPRGRVYKCQNPGCGAVLSRDGNGAANICSRYRFGEYGHVHLSTITYLRATVVEPGKRANVAGLGQKPLTSVMG